MIEDRRAAALALGCVFASFVIALAFPYAPLVFAPLVLGVPHLASEVRWLIARRALPIWALALSGVHAAALVALALWAFAGGPVAMLARAELLVAGSWVIVLSPPRIALVALALAGVAVFSETFALALRDIAIAVHGFVSIAIWVFAFRRKKRFAVPAAFATLVGFVGIGLLRDRAVAQAFLLSVHYAVWIVLIPHDGSRAAARSWRRDLGRAGIVLAVSAAVAVAVLAFALGPERARDAYLATARFHIWFELAMAGWLLR